MLNQDPSYHFSKNLYKLKLNNQEPRNYYKNNSYELIRELPLYDDINISRKERAFREYAETYKVEIINNKTFLLNY